MASPSIVVINFSGRSDEEVQEAIRAVNRQVNEDFVPVWGQGRALQLYGAAFDPREPDVLQEERIPGDSVLYLVDEASLPGALGYHSLNAAELPVGFVFAMAQDWTITLSHEALELIVDPNVNAFIPGPHPTEPNRWVLHTYEVCDAAERTSYPIDGVQVSNFLTPQYFVDGDARGTRNDFLNAGVRSFGVIRGSHVAYVDPVTWNFEQVIGQEMPRLKAQAERVERADRAKPLRPSDGALRDVLESTRKRLAGRGRGDPLPTLQGITRTSRYEASAARMRQTVTAPRRPLVIEPQILPTAAPTGTSDRDVEQLAAQLAKQIRDFESRRNAH